MQSIVSYLVVAVMACMSALSHARCTRDIKVPISSIGLSVVTSDDGAVSGVYPDVLRAIESKSGCTFKFSVVPRARLDAMFEAGQVDVLIPASKSPRRDALGIFVPLVWSRATLISLESNHPVIKNSKELVTQANLKVGLVRGFDFGPNYQTIVKELTRQGRVVQEVDALSVARLLQAGAIDLTIMAPSIFAGAIHGEDKTAGLLPKLRYEPIDELPWGESGAYISKSALSAVDQQTLAALLERAATSGMVWTAFQKYYPEGTLSGSIRAR